MKDLVTIRLGPETREALTKEAKRMGIPFRTLLRTIAEERAVEARRREIRAQGKALAERVKQSRTRREFFEDWGSPLIEIDE